MKIAGGLGLVALLALVSCGQEQDDIRLQQIVCPSVAVPPYARDLVQWQGDGHDLTNLAYRVRLADAEGSCTRKDRDDNLYVDLAVSFSATRGPALAGRAIKLHYFVAVLKQGAIIDKQVYDLPAAFEPNAQALNVAGKPVTMTLPLAADVTGSDYALETGLQLTSTQLADNIAASRR